MATSYDDAVAALYQAPHGAFVAERKRLASELKAAGDKAGAARLGKLPRPPASAWAVNQLWWQDRAAFEALFAVAKKVRDGDLAATTEHRDALAKLRARAQGILVDAGNAAAEPTLRRIGTTLAALAASGSFEPDPPGALAEDRDPPGFEALGGLVTAPAPRAADVVAPDHAAAHERRQAAADARRREEERTKLEAAVRAAERALTSAKAEREARDAELDRLRKAVVAAEHALARAEERIPALEAELAQRARALEDAKD